MRRCLHDLSFAVVLAAATAGGPNVTGTAATAGGPLPTGDAPELTPAPAAEFTVDSGMTKWPGGAAHLHSLPDLGGGARIDESGDVHLAYGDADTIRYAVWRPGGVVTNVAVGTGTNVYAAYDGTLSDSDYLDAHVRLVELAQSDARDTMSLDIASAHGVPEPSIGRHTYVDGATVSCDAPPSPADETNGTRWVCTGWTGTGSVPASGTSNRVAFTITTNSMLTWQWTNEFGVSASVVGGGSVDVGAGWHRAGTSARVRAIPAAGSVFVRWTGPVVSSNSPAGSVTVTSPVALTATFAPAVLAPDGAWHAAAAGIVKPTLMNVVDVDNDGDMDLLATRNDESFVCWENVNGGFTSLTDHDIGTLGSGGWFKYLTPGDLNGDGRMDLLGGETQSGGDHVWFENPGTLTSAWARRSVFGGVGMGPYFAIADDLDGDGDRDVVCNRYWSDSVYVVKNNNGLGTSWSGQTLDSNAKRPVRFITGDIDGDGDRDVIVSATEQDDIVWWENKGGTWTSHGVGTLDNPLCNSIRRQPAYVQDMDGDGDMDILSNTAEGGGIAWFESVAPLAGTFVKHSVVPDIKSDRTFDVVDFDNDADLDLVCLSAASNCVFWLERLDATGTNWATHALPMPGLTSLDEIIAEDMNGDGWADILLRSQQDGKILWWTRNARTTDSDRDGDELPDAWELTQFGDLDENANGDTDGDGRTHGAEYALQSDPTSFDVPSFDWAVTLGGADTEMAWKHLGLDRAGNVYVSVNARSTFDADPGPGTVEMENLGDYDGALLKYDARGRLLWARRIAGPGREWVEDLAVTPGGEVCVAGEFSGTVDFARGAETNRLTAGGKDVFVARYAADGSLAWAFNLGSASDDGARALALAPNGDVLVGGYFQGDMDADPGTNVVTLTHSGGVDTFLARYTAAGQLVWANAIGGGGTADILNVLKTDGADGILIGGVFSSSPLDFDPGDGTAARSPHGGGQDLYLARYASNGDFAWVRTFGGSSFENALHDIATDADGNIYITGFVKWGDMDMDSGPGMAMIANSGGFADAFLAKYDVSGNYVWANRFGAGGNDTGESVYVRENRLMMVCNFDYTVDFDPGVGTANFAAGGSIHDIFIGTYTLDGAYAGGTDVGGSQEDDGNSVLCDAVGNLYACGMFRDTVDFDPGPNTVNRTAAGPDAFIVKWGPPQVEFASERQTVYEGETVAVDVYLTQPLEHGVEGTVTVAAGGTAEAGMDVTLVSNRFSIAAGDTTGRVWLSVTADDTPELAETVVLAFASVSGAPLGIVTQCVVTISGAVPTLSVASSHGEPAPPVGLHPYEDGTVVDAAAPSPADETNGTRWVCTGWTGSGNAPESGSSNSVSFTITTNSTLTWQWAPEYFLDTGLIHDELHNLDNNRLPDDWNELVTAGSTAFINGRYQAFATNALAQLRGPVTVPDEADAVILEFDGSLQASTVGMSVGAIVHSSTLPNLEFSHSTSINNPNGLAESRARIREESTVGLLTQNDYPTQLTNFHYRVELRDGFARYTAVADGETTPYFNETATIADLDIQSITNLSCLLYTTTLANPWVDNVRVSVSRGIAGGRVDVASQWLDAGSATSITATPMPGYYFRRWSGDVPGGAATANPLQVTMDGARRVTAEFTSDSTESGLVAYYPFNGNANDESGNGYDGNILGDPEYVADLAGNATRALYFDGTGDYIDVPESESWQMSSLTVCGWFTWDDFDRVGYLASRGDQAGYQFSIYSSGGRYLQFHVNAHSGDASVRGPTGWGETGRWDHVAAVYDAKAKLQELYINGILVTSRTYNVVLNNPAKSFRIGSLQWDNNTYLHKGKADEIRVYSRALSSNEITRLHMLPLEQGLVAYYPFDTDTIDHGPYHNDGAWNGGSLASGAVDQGYGFSAGQYYSVSDGTNMDAFTAITVCAWFRGTLTNPDGEHLLNKGMGDWDPAPYDYSMFSLFLDYYGGTHRFIPVVINESGYPLGTDMHPTPVRDIGVWHHYAMTYNGTEMRAYLDGVLTSSSTNASGRIATRAADPLYINRHNWPPSSHSERLAGTVDDVRIYSRALSAEEMRILGSVGDGTGLHRITADCGLNGSISPSGPVQVVSGSNVTFTITPNARYYVSDVVVDTVSIGPTNTYSFHDVTADHTIYADFAYAADRIFLDSASVLNNVALNAASNELTLLPGAPISGTLQLVVEQDHGPGPIVPVCYTPSWGEHRTSWREVTSHAPAPTNSYAVPIDLTAPDVGQYYISFASAGQIAAHYVASMTDWAVGPSVWDDGNDLADFDETRFGDCMSNGFTLAPHWNGSEFRDGVVGCTYIKVSVRNPADRIFLMPGGALNGTVVSAQNNTISLYTGEPVTGTVNILVHNDHGSGPIVPVCYTPSWGDHASSWVSVTGNTPQDTTPYAVPISLTAPRQAGEYLITFASEGQTAGSYIASRTSWPVGTNVWNDGLDLADLTATNMPVALLYGYAEAALWDGAKKSPGVIGCTYVRIHVDPAPVQLAVVSPHGIVVPTGTNAFEQGSNVSCRVLASPADETNGTRWVCTGWTGSGNVPASGSSNSVSFTITTNSTLTWQWAPEYFLDTGASGSGTVDVADGWYEASAAVRVTATPGEGYGFAGWTGDVAPAQTNLTTIDLTMDGPRTVVAHFEAVATNRPPVLVVGERDIYLTSLGDFALLDASASYDLDDDPLFFSWREALANSYRGLIPVGAESLGKLRIHFPYPGRYTFSVQVGDGQDVSALTETINVYVPGLRGVVHFAPSEITTLPDASVTAYRTQADVIMRTNAVDAAVTDSFGNYVLEKVSPVSPTQGQFYYLRIERPGFLARTESRLVLPNPGPDSEQTDLSLERGWLATLTGTVTDTNGRPIQATVAIVPTIGGEPKIADTDDLTGNFEFAQVPMGSWLLQLHAGSGYQPEVRDINVGTNMGHCVFRMAPATGYGSLTGRVVSADTGAPISGALIELVGVGAQDRSDAAGRYDFTGLPSGTYMLVCEKDEYRTLRVASVRVSAGANPQELPMYLSAAVAVSGRITDGRDGRPVAQATVGISAGAGLLRENDVTDRTGYYCLEDVPAGDQQFVVSARGYLTRVISGTVGGSFVMDLELERSADWTAAKATSEKPVAAVAASVIHLPNLATPATLDATRSTGGGLRYIWRESPSNPQLGHIPAGSSTRGSFFVYLTKPGVYVFEVAVRNAGGVSANTASITVLAPGLSGNVHASPSDGVIGVPSMLVRAYEDYDAAAALALTGFHSAYSDGRGDFTMNTVSTGDYWVVVGAQAGYQQYGPVMHRVNYSTTARGIAINLPRPEYEFQGYVHDSANTNLPLENVRVIIAPGSVTESYRTTTDATGHFHLFGVPAGSQTVLLMKDGYNTRKRDVTISGNKTQPFLLERSASESLGVLAGDVSVYSNGRSLPVPHAEIIVGSGTFRALTDSLGHYEIRGVPPGSYYGVVRKEGYRTAWLYGLGIFEVAAGVTNTYDKTLEFSDHGNAVSGIVLDEGGARVTNALISVVAAPAARSARFGLDEDIATDEDGGFLLSDLPEGVHQLRIDSAGETRYCMISVNANMNAMLNLAEASTVPYSWKERYFGTTAIADFDLTDSDHDGAVNRDEYIADTDPTDDTSFFAPLGGVTRAGACCFELAGSSTGRLYEVYWRGDLMRSAWQPFGTSRYGTGSALSLCVTNAPPLPSCFYRCGVRLPR